MSDGAPDYLQVPAEQLGEGTPVRVRIIGDLQDVARDMAEVMLASIERGREAGRPATFIIPVGPVDQFPVLAERINRNRIDCRNVMLINMDEYLTDDDQWVDLDHPLGFRGFMNRKFYDLSIPNWPHCRKTVSFLTLEIQTSSARPSTIGAVSMSVSVELASTATSHSTNRPNPAKRWMPSSLPPCRPAC